MKLERTLILPPAADNPRNSEGSFVTLNDGRVMFVYTRYYGDRGNDNAPAELVARFSADGGKSWLADERVVVPNEGVNVMSVSLLRLADGRIIMCYLRKTAAPGHGEDDLDCCGCAPYCRFSSDEGASWSEPVEVVGIPGYFSVNNDRLIQLSCGRLLMPVAWHLQRRVKGRPVLDTHSLALFFVSDDGGATWRETLEWVLPPGRIATGFQESGAVELSDGRILAYFRNNHGMQYTCHSADKGERWSIPAPNPDFPSPESPMSMKRDPATGVLYAIWNDRQPRWGVTPAPETWNRTPLVMAASDDDGATWRDPVALEDSPTHGYCYTAMHFVDGALLLGYCSGGDGILMLRQLTLARLNLKH